MSPQVQQLYKVLLASKTPLPAADLAEKLKIVPNSIYRLTDQLLAIGLITKTQNYPNSFKATSAEESLSAFLLYQNTWFSDHFSKISPDSMAVSFSFIQSRDELMNLSVDEVNKATKSIDLLRSGAEFPADLLLAMVNAKKRGAVSRMLIQDYSNKNANLVEGWKRNGILVRKSPLQHLRLMLYDSKVLYFMSYRHTESEKDLGLKINYPPFAAILSHQFDQWWKNAEVL